MSADDIGEAITLQTDDSFTSDLASIIARAEDLRISNMKTYRGRGFISTTFSIIAISLGGAGFGWALFFEADIFRALTSMAAAGLVPLFLHFWAEQPLKTYAEQYKSVLMPAMAKAMGGLKFHPTRGISAKIAKASGLIPSFDEYKAEDCFMGKHKGVKLILSEARLRKNNQTAYVFDGIFVMLEIPDLDFEGHTIITNDHRAIRKWRHTRWAKLQDLHAPALKAFATEDDDGFYAFSSAPDTARKLITQPLIKEFKEMGELFDKTYISATFFRKKYLFITIPHEKDMFEPSNLYVPITSRQDALRCKREIEQILSIIDVMYVEHGQKSASENFQSLA